MAARFKGLRTYLQHSASTRGTRRDYAHFVSIARSSPLEVETYVMISERLGFVSSAATRDLLERITELGRMLTSLRQRLVEARI